MYLRKKLRNTYWNMKKELPRVTALKSILAKTPEAVMVQNKYKVLTKLVYDMFPDSQEIPKEKLEEWIYTAVNGDRDWRKYTEGYDSSNKQTLEEQWLKNNGYK